MSDMKINEATGDTVETAFQREQRHSRPRHNYPNDTQAHMKFMEMCDARALDCLEQGEQAFTEHEQSCWKAMAEAIRMSAKAMPYLGTEAAADVDSMRARKHEFKSTMVEPLMRRFEWIRTSAERELVTARIDGMNAALDMFSHYTGIYG